ncbi:unnamed protein product [Caenorhabditis angaria]|uniref:Uncharacterized protein n=1 Tax=Caenorhabditis angaria TaxID=860376 RepID=A0A9P1MXD2_9PELO|nr:unnamed protein product [Caenorhabditis angaria]
MVFLYSLLVIPLLISPNLAELGIDDYSEEELQKPQKPFRIGEELMKHVETEALLKTFFASRPIANHLLKTIVKAEKNHDRALYSSVVDKSFVLRGCQREIGYERLKKYAANGHFVKKLGSLKIKTAKFVYNSLEITVLLPCKYQSFELRLTAKEIDGSYKLIRADVGDLPICQRLHLGEAGRTASGIAENILETIVQAEKTHDLALFGLAVDSKFILHGCRNAVRIEKLKKYVGHGYFAQKLASIQVLSSKFAGKHLLINAEFADLNQTFTIQLVARKINGIHRLIFANVEDLPICHRLNFGDSIKTSKGVAQNILEVIAKAEETHDKALFGLAVDKSFKLQGCGRTVSHQKLKKYAGRGYFSKQVRSLQVIASRFVGNHLEFIANLPGNEQNFNVKFIAKKINGITKLIRADFGELPICKRLNFGDAIKTPKGLAENILQVIHKAEKTHDKRLFGLVIDKTFDIHGCEKTASYDKLKNYAGHGDFASQIAALRIVRAYRVNGDLQFLAVLPGNFEFKFSAKNVNGLTKLVRLDIGNLPVCQRLGLGVKTPEGLAKNILQTLVIAEKIHDRKLLRLVIDKSFVFTACKKTTRFSKLQEFAGFEYILNQASSLRIIKSRFFNDKLQFKASLPINNKNIILKFIALKFGGNYKLVRVIIDEDLPICRGLVLGGLAKPAILNRRVNNLLEVIRTAERTQDPALFRLAIDKSFKLQACGRTVSHQKLAKYFGHGYFTNQLSNLHVAFTRKNKNTLISIAALLENGKSHIIKLTSAKINGITKLIRVDAGDLPICKRLSLGAELKTPKGIANNILQVIAKAEETHDKALYGLVVDKSFKLQACGRTVSYEKLGNYAGFGYFFNQIKSLKIISARELGNGITFTAMLPGIDKNIIVTFVAAKIDGITKLIHAMFVDFPFCEPGISRKAVLGLVAEKSINYTSTTEKPKDDDLEERSPLDF